MKTLRYWKSGKTRAEAFEISKENNHSAIKEKLGLLTKLAKTRPPKNRRWNHLQFFEYVSSLNRLRKSEQIYFAYVLIEDALKAKLIVGKDNFKFQKYLEKLHKSNPTSGSRKNTRLPVTDWEKLCESMWELAHGKDKCITAGNTLLAKTISTTFDTGRSYDSILSKLKKLSKG